MGPLGHAAEAGQATAKFDQVLRAYCSASDQRMPRSARPSAQWAAMKIAITKRSIINVCKHDGWRWTTIDELCRVVGRRARQSIISTAVATPSDQHFQGAEGASTL